MRDRRTRREFAQWIVVEAYVALALAPLIYDAAQGRLDRQREVVATSLIVILLIGLLLRRPAAWLLLVLFDALVVISNAWDWRGALVLALTVATFALLVSPPMRRYIGSSGSRGCSRGAAAGGGR
jgi:hypothetical protein